MDQGVITIIVAVALIIFIAVCLYRYHKTGKIIGGDKTTISYKRSFLTPVIQQAIDNVSKGYYNDNFERNVMENLWTFRIALNKYNSGKSELRKILWEELKLPIIEAIVTLKIDEGTLIKCEKVLGAGSYNVAFALKDGRVLRVFKYEKYDDDYKSMTIENRRSVRRVIEDFPNEPGFPQLYNGSYKHFHYQKGNKEVGWMVVKKYKPLTFEYAKKNIEKYYIAMCEIAHKLHIRRLGYSDWKILNMMVDPDIDAIILTDLDLEKYDDKYPVSTHRINWETDVTRDVRDYTTIAREIWAIFSSKNEDEYWDKFIVEEDKPKPTIEDINRDFEQVKAAHPLIKAEWEKVQNHIKAAAENS